MNTNSEFDSEMEDGPIRQLVAEMVAQAPAVGELSTLRLGDSPVISSSSNTSDVPSFQWPRIAVATALLLAAAIGGWWLARPDTTMVATQTPLSEQPYRWEASFAGLDHLSMDGAIDPSINWSRFRWHSGDDSLELISDGEIIGTRYVGNGELVALSEEQAAEISGNWYLNGDRSPVVETGAFLDDVTMLDMFKIDDWEDLGSEEINGVSTRQLRTVSSPEPEAERDLLELVSLFAVGWDGPLDVWARDDGRIAQIVLYHDRESELVESARVVFFDFGLPIDTRWPDGAPPTEQFPS